MGSSDLRPWNNGYLMVIFSALGCFWSMVLVFSMVFWLLTKFLDALGILAIAWGSTIDLEYERPNNG
jgi:hypothetical protein